MRVEGFGRRRFEIEPEIARRDLEKFVSFLGPIPSAGVPQFLYEADIGLHLTEVHAELCSLTILEMMAAGLPIVAEPKGCLPEMIVHGENGFLTTEEEEIAGYLKELIISPKLSAWRRQSRNGEATRLRTLSCLVAEVGRRDGASLRKAGVGRTRAATECDTAVTCA